MSIDTCGPGVVTWRSELPTLTGRLVMLREVTPDDCGILVALLSLGDASRFGLEAPLHDEAVQDFVERVPREREAGLAVTWTIVLRDTGALAGLIQIRQLEPSFETAEWECILAPFARGTGAFLEAARLAGSFAFADIGAHRIEARVLLQNGRANGALRKLGGVQEGVLRRSARRDGRHCDQALWSVLKEDWGVNWVSTARRVH